MYSAKFRRTTCAQIGLDALFVRLPGAPTHVIDTGLDLTGEVPGRLHGWFPTVKGDWLGAVDYEIRYADGRRFSGTGS